MAWVKIDENMTDHPKLVEAGPLAGWLYVCGLSYCNRLTTDGFIPEVVLHRLGAFSLDDEVRLLAVTLTHVGLWEWDDDRRGWWVHDYSEYQPTRSDATAKSEQARAAALSRWGKRDAPADECDPQCEPDAERIDPAMPRTDPSRTEPKEPSANPPLAAVPDPPEPMTAASRRPEFFDDFEKLWNVYPRKVKKAAAYDAYVARRRERTSHESLMAAVTHYAEARRGHDQQHTQHGSTFLAGGRLPGPWSEWVGGPPDGARAGPQTPADVIAQARREREAK